METLHRRLLGQAERAFGGRPVAATVARVRAIIGPARMPEGEEAAARALEQLRSGRVPSAEDLMALQLVIRLTRPALLSRSGELEPLPAHHSFGPEQVAAWDRFRVEVRPLLYSVGRIDRGSEAFGTGFLVAADLLITNRHVLDGLSFGTRVLDRGGAVVRFGMEHDGDRRAPVPIEGVEAVHPELDMALLRIAPQADAPPFEISTVAAEVGAAVVAIGYPFEDSDRNPLFMDALYGGIYGVKRASPGEVIDVGPRELAHDCSTLGGNSGSPLLSIETLEVVGLHRTGLFSYRNEAVDAPSVAGFVEEALAAREASP